MLSYFKSFLFCVGLCVFFVGCSVSASIGGEKPEDVAVKLIEGDLATNAGLQDVQATCDSPSSKDVGVAFNCKSSSNIGEILWAASIESDDIVNVESSNLLTSADRAKLESTAVDLVGQQIGQPLGVEHYTCGDGPVIVNDLTLDCILTDPVNGDKYDSEITFDDTSFTNPFVTVASAPRQ